MKQNFVLILLIIGLSSTASDGDVVIDNIKRYEGTSAFRWGPNCFNSALLALGSTENQMFSSSATINSFVENYCVEISKGELASGDLILYKELDQFKVWLYNHAAIFISPNEFYHKLGLNSLAEYEYFTPGKVEGSREKYDFEKHCKKEDYQCYRPHFYRCKNENIYNAVNKFEEQWNVINSLLSESVGQRFSTSKLSKLADEYIVFESMINNNEQDFREWLTVSKSHWHTLINDHDNQLYGYFNFPFKYSNPRMEKALKRADDKFEALKRVYIRHLKVQVPNIYSKYKYFLK